MSKRSSSLARFDQSAFRVRGFLKPAKAGSKTSVIEQLLADARQVLLVEVPSDPLSETDDVGCWPSTTSMNGSPGGGKGATVGSRTETAALGRADRGVPADPVSSIAQSVETHVLEIERHLTGLLSDLARRARLQQVGTTGDENTRYCYVAKLVHRLPFDAVWEPHKQTTFAGVLDRPWPEPQWVCRWVYDFTRSHKRLPTEDEMRQYLSTGRVRVHEAGTAR